MRHRILYRCQCKHDMNLQSISDGCIYVRGDLRLSGQFSSTGMNSFGFTLFCDELPFTVSASSSSLVFLGLTSSSWGSAFLGAALALRLGGMCGSEWTTSWGVEIERDGRELDGWWVKGPICVGLGCDPNRKQWCSKFQPRRQSLLLPIGGLFGKSRPGPDLQAWIWQELLRPYNQSTLLN